jgi:hypothetical protein
VPRPASYRFPLPPFQEYENVLTELKEMKEKLLLVPDLFSFSLSIASLVNLGRYAEMMNTFREMSAMQINPSVFTMYTPMALLFKQERWTALLELLPMAEALIPQVNSALRHKSRLMHLWYFILVSAIRNCQSHEHYSGIDPEQLQVAQTLLQGIIKTIYAFDLVSNEILIRLVEKDVKKQDFDNVKSSLESLVYRHTHEEPLTVRQAHRLALFLYDGTNGVPHPRLRKEIGELRTALGRLWIKCNNPFRARASPSVFELLKRIVAEMNDLPIATLARTTTSGSEAILIANPIAINSD